MSQPFQGRKKSEEKADDNAGERNLIGDNLVVKVDEGDNHKAGAEDKQGKKRERQAELEKKQQGQQPVQSLDQRIAPGDGRMAGAALCPEDKKTDERDIVIPADLVAAHRAGRRRKDNRLILRQTADADVEKRADNRAEDEGEYVE